MASAQDWPSLGSSLGGKASSPNTPFPGLVSPFHNQAAWTRVRDTLTGHSLVFYVLPVTCDTGREETEAQNRPRQESSPS